MVTLSGLVLVLGWMLSLEQTKTLMSEVVQEESKTSCSLTRRKPRHSNVLGCGL
ncbi:hypothetical protein AMTRI_Chr08g167180 [Amborella trichopoda]